MQSLRWFGVSINSTNFATNFKPFFSKNALSFSNRRGNHSYTTYSRAKMIRFGVCAATFGLTVSAGVALRGAGRCENDGPARPGDRVFTAEQKSDEERAGKTSLTAAIREGRKMVQRRKEEVGSPGIVIAVSIDGKEVWSEGFGYSDVENHVRCTPDTVMRIASISKPITTMIVARLWEAGKIDFDEPVQHYIPDFPLKSFAGEEVTITTRHLMSHLSGIRHYNKTPPKCQDVNSENKDLEKVVVKSKQDQNTEETKLTTKDQEKSSKQKHSKLKKYEFDTEEHQIKKHFKEVSDSLSLFKDDLLHYKPGSKFLYTTHGYTLLSAVIEGATRKKFPDLLKQLFLDLGLENTYLDENNPLIPHRSRFYRRNSKGLLENVPYVDLSYKWAGGGLLSNVQDILKLANIMLYSYQFDDLNKDGQQMSNRNQQTSGLNNNSDSTKPGYLKQKTVQMMWTPVEKTVVCRNGINKHYGMGWEIFDHEQTNALCRESTFVAHHTGGAIGSSSVVMVMPRPQKQHHPLSAHPQGVSVAIMTNLQNVSLSTLGKNIARLFMNVDL